MRKIGVPPQEPKKRWMLVPVTGKASGLIVKEVGSGLFREDGSRPRAFVEVDDDA